MPPFASNATALTSAARSADGCCCRTTAATARALRLRTRFVHGEVAAAVVVVVQRGDRLLRVLVGRHLDEREAARAAGGHVAHHVDAFHRAGAGKQLLEVLFDGLVRQVADVELSSHLSLLTFAPLRGAPDVLMIP